MKLHAVIFTWPPDYAAAELAVRALSRLGIPVTLAVDQGDAAPEIDGAAVVVTTFPRNGNLNGRACLDGELEVLQSLDAEAVLVVDSDTLVFDAEWFHRDLRDHALAGYSWGTRPLMGCCYGIRSDSLAGLRQVLAAHPDFDGPEDILLWRLAETAGVATSRLPHSKTGPGLSFWNWRTRLSAAEYRRRFEVITVQRDASLTDTCEARARVTARMRILLDSESNPTPEPTPQHS